MNEKLRRVVSIIALVAMGIFSVALVLFFAAPKLLNGQIGFVALYSGCIGIALWFVVKFTAPKKSVVEDMLTREDDEIIDASEIPAEDKDTADEIPTEDKNTAGEIPTEEKDTAGEIPTEEKDNADEIPTEEKKSVNENKKPKATTKTKK